MLSALDYTTIVAALIAAGASLINGIGVAVIIARTRMRNGGTIGSVVDDTHAIVKNGNDTP